MSKAGKRLIKAVKEALKAAKCEHRWMDRLHPQQRWLECAKCGIRKHFWRHP